MENIVLLQCSKSGGERERQVVNRLCTYLQGFWHSARNAKTIKRDSVGQIKRRQDDATASDASLTRRNIFLSILDARRYKWIN